MIPLYILGLLERFGPQHGYQIKKTIGEQLSDFTQIKLPVIYYHLEKMEAEGLLESSSEKTDARPQKTVYAITDEGRKAFRGKLEELLMMNYQPVFPSDGLFYFSDYLVHGSLAEALQIYIAKLESVIRHIEKHMDETLEYIPEDMKTEAGIIFDHHLRHYHAELDWAVESQRKINPGGF